MNIQKQVCTVTKTKHSEHTVIYFYKDVNIFGDTLETSPDLMNKLR